jgi:hypothetical protein
MNIKADRISIGWGIDFGDPAGDITTIMSPGMGGLLHIYNRTERNPTVTNKPHKYADVIKAWADGKVVQFADCVHPTAADPLCLRSPDWRDWTDQYVPSFGAHFLWRIKPEPLEWQAEREAHARGEKIEYRITILGIDGVDCAKWRDIDDPSWSSLASGVEYRVKPKPAKWQKEREAFERGERVQFSSDDGKTWSDLTTGRWVDWDWPVSTFRIPHKWQEVLDAQQRGEKIQLKSPTSDVWEDALFKMTCNDGTTMYRVKPKPVTKRVRVALLGRSDGTVWPRAVFDDGVATEVTKQPDFIRWVADWSEVELPKQKRSPTAAEVMARADEAMRSILAGCSSQEEQMREISRAFGDCAALGVGWAFVDPVSLHPFSSSPGRLSKGLKG